MKKTNITKRDIIAFFLGVITVIVIDLIFNWEENKQDFLDGRNAAKEEIRK